MSEKDAHIALHPLRRRLIENLARKPSYISALSRDLKIERQLTSYHLQILEGHGLVTSEFKISQQKKSFGKALRCYSITPKCQETIDELLNSLQPHSKPDNTEDR